MTHDSAVRWHPVELLDWIQEPAHHGAYSLVGSAVPSITSLDRIPGGPFAIRVWGNNTHGHPDLKKVIAKMYGATPEQVLLAQGASQCDALLIGAILQQGGTAVVETPVYEPILRAVELFANKVIRLPRRRENGFLPDPDELRNLLTPDTKVVLLTNLYNPAGIFLDNGLLAELVAVAADAGAVVICDEVFLRMKEPDYLRHGFSAGAVSVGSMDKSYGMDYLRVGWAVGPQDLIQKANQLHNVFGAAQPFVTEDITWQILSRPEALRFFNQRADKAMQGRVLLEEFAESMPHVNVIMPSSGINAIIELPKGMDDTEFTNQLRERKGVTVFPGSLFEWPGAIRVSFGGDTERTKEAFRRLRDMILELAV